MRIYILNTCPIETQGIEPLLNASELEYYLNYQSTLQNRFAFFSSAESSQL